MDSEPSLRYFDNAIPDEPANEDATAAVFDEAPVADVLPEETGSAEENPSTDSTPDYKTLYEQAETQRQAEAKERRRTEQQIAQQQREQARQQWQAQAGQIVEQARKLDYDDALNYVVNNFVQREQAILQAAEQSTMGTHTEQWASHLIKEYGLDPEDRAALGNDPYQMEALAQVAKRNREKFANLEKQIKQTQRGQAAQARLASGVDRTGGGQGRPLPQDLRDLSPEDHLKAIFQQAGVI